MFKKSKILKSIREDLERGMRLKRAVKNAGLRSRQTLQNWRNKKPMIDRYILQCMGWGEEAKTDMVEDAYVKKMVEGNGSPADFIFYLTNRRPGKWKDRRAVIGNVNVNTKINSDNRSVHFEQCSDSELRKIADFAR